MPKVSEETFLGNFIKQFLKINLLLRKKLYFIQQLWCTARHVLRNLFSANQENGSEMTFVVGATKVNLRNLKTSLWLDDLMQATIWRHQLYSDGWFEPWILAEILLDVIS